MINSSALLTDLRRVLRALQGDLRARIGEQASLSESLQAEWKDARDAGRTGVTYTEWLDDEITQAAIHWILGCVFLRFLEDNHFLERPYLAGSDQNRLALARDCHSTCLQCRDQQPKACGSNCIRIQVDAIHTIQRLLNEVAEIARWLVACP